MTKGEKRLLFWVGVFVALVGGVTWWWTDLNETPHITFPKRVLPEPNAKAFYLNAATMCKDKVVLTDAYIAWQNSSRKLPPKDKITLALQRNEPALSELRNGFAQQYGETEPTAVDGDNPAFFEDLRFLQRLLTVKTHVDAEKGNWDSVAQCWLDSMELSVSCARQGAMRNAACSYELESFTRRHCREFITSLPAEVAKAAARRLASIIKQRTSWVDVLEEEKWAELAILQTRINDPEWRPSLSLFFQRHGNEFDRQAYFNALFIRKRDVIQHFVTGIDAIKQDGNKSYALQTRFSLPMNDRDVCLLLPDYERKRHEYVFNETQDAMLLCELALHAYKEEHGSYPKTLTQLVPSYLKAIPDDPFAKSGPLRYKPTQNGYLLYSVGSNGKDDGGMPSIDSHHQAFPVGAKRGTGDIVAEINTEFP